MTTAIAPIDAIAIPITQPTQIPAPYYGVPFLKPPRWGWEIALYFFTEGISAGSFVYAAMAAAFGGPQHRPIIRTARWISFATLLPCPPLLIADLGRPERFLYMLRIFKPTSPMSVGAWALSAYGASATLALLPSRAANLAGLPFALTMIAYPGVLLSTTSTPAWMHTRVLGALLAASSMANAAAALLLATALSGRTQTPTHKALQRIDQAAHLTEAAALSAYLYTARDFTKPLTSGRQSTLFWFGAVGLGLVASTLIPKRTRTGSILSALCSLAGGLGLKWAIVHAGPDSARDSSANHASASPSPESPGWPPHQNPST